MHVCPHCQQAGITSWAKLTSVSFAPATCTLCGRQAYLHVAHTLKALLVWIIITWVFIGIALWQTMAIYLIGTVPALLLGVDKCMLAAPMEPC